MSDLPEAPYESALFKVGAKKDLTAEEVARLKATIKRVGWVESKNDPLAVQGIAGGGTGPGRGLFQYEALGEDGSSATAKNRLKWFEKNYGKVDLPQSDRDEMAEDVPDFTNISEDGQRAILLADWVARTPGDQVGEVARGEMTDKDFWLDYHWAGAPNSPKKRAKKGLQWDKEMVDYARLVGGTN